MAKRTAIDTTTYDTHVHRWCIDQVQRDDLSVVVDQFVSHEYLSFSERTLWIRPRLGLESFTWALARANLYLHFPEQMPGARGPVAPVRPSLRVIHGGGQ